MAPEQTPQKPANGGGAARDPAESAFCALAVELGVLAAESVEAAFALQARRRREGKNDPIAFLLLEQGALEGTDVQKVREEERRRASPRAEGAAPKARPPRPPSGAQAVSPAPAGGPECESEEEEARREGAFEKLAVQLGFVSPERLEECKGLRDERRAEGKGDPLGFILLEKGYITSHQVQHVQEELKKSLGKPRVGGYELDSEIERGATGVVFRARQISLEREVALKVIPKTARAGESFKARFFREARIAAKLNHPNILKAIDCGETETHYYFAMELFVGKTLLEVIQDSKRLAESQAVEFGIQIARALVHAHQNGLVHRDIRPENVLVEPEGKQIKVRDMGLAKSTEEEDASVRKERSAAATPFYTSPEQIRGAADVDIRADLYALGGTLYHMLVGTPPFQASTPILVIKKHLEEPPIPPKLKVPRISDEMNRIVMKLLEKDRNQRYPDPAALLAELERLRAVGAEKAAAVTGGKPATAAPRGARRREGGSPGVLVAAGLAVVLALVVIGILVFRAQGGGDAGRKPDVKPGAGGGTGGGGEATTRDTREEKARKALEEARRFAVANPDRIEEILDRYRAIVRDYPQTGAYAAARDAIAEVEKRRTSDSASEVARAVDAALARAGEEKFKEALDLLAPLAAASKDEKSRAAVRAAEERIREGSVAARDRRVEQARLAAERGKWEEAISLLKGVEAFGMPGLAEGVKALIEGYEREKKESAYLTIHLRLLDRIAASGLASGLSFLSEELAKTEDFDVKERVRKDVVNLDRAKNVHEAAMRGARALSAPRVWRLNSGEVVAAEAEVAGGDLRLKGPEGERTVKVSDLSALDVRELAKPDPLPLACYAWYVLRDLRFLLECCGTDPERAPDDLGALARLALSCSRQRMGSAADAMANGASTEAAAFVREWAGLSFFRPREDEFRALVARVAGSADPFLFGGIPRDAGTGEVAVQWDFPSEAEFAPFLVPGGGAWKAGWGTLEQTLSGAGQVDAFPEGSWVSFKARMEVLFGAPPAGIGFNFHQQTDGRRYAFEARACEEGLRVAFYFKAKDVPAMFLLGSARTIEGVDLTRFHTISLEVKDGRFTGAFDSDEVKAGPEDREAASSLGHVDLSSGRFGVRLSSPAVVRRLAVEGRLEASWAASLTGPELPVALASGREAPLFDGGTLRGWEVLAGRASAMGGAIRCEGPLSAAARISGSLLDGRQPREIRLQARRVGGASFLLLGFRHGRVPRVVAVRPAVTESRPEALDPDVQLVEAPIGDGQWHDLRLVLKPEGVELWSDGARRFQADGPAIANWPYSRLHFWGFGIGSAGGDWEVRQIVAANLKP
jgi:hypothetical protein